MAMFHSTMPIHMIQCWRDVSHQAHEKERDLQDRGCNELHPSHQLIIPRHRIEVDEEGGSP